MKIKDTENKLIRFCFGEITEEFNSKLLFLKILDFFYFHILKYFGNG